MKRLVVLVVVIIALLSIVTGVRAAEIKSVSRITFGPENILFVADWKSAEIHAITLAPGAKEDGKLFNLRNFDAVIAKAVGKSTATIEDLAWRPGTNEAYVALSLEPAKKPVILIVKADGSVKSLDLKASKSTVAKLDKSPNDKLTFWNTIPGRSFTITDMKWRNGELFVAGLSNQDFASTLRRIKYPFTGPASMTSIEIFHTVHDQVETRAPIRAMTFADLDGKPHLIAAYTCTPLVTIPLDALKDGAHLRGKTIAELGYGNAPSAMLSYTGSDMQGKPSSYILVLNANRDADVMSVSSVQEANRRPGLIKAAENFAGVTGIQPTMAPLAGAWRIDNQNGEFFIAVRRKMASGASELVSINKDFKARISDFITEYNFPGYSYSAAQKANKDMESKMKRDEGFSNLVKE